MIEDNSSAHASKPLRLVVYAALVLSAGTSLLLGDRLWNSARQGDLPSWAPLFPSITFTIFVVIYAVDRWLLIKKHNYPPGRALFQVGFAIVFLTLLWPQQADEFRKSETVYSDRALRLLKHRDADVRALACEVLGLKGEPGVLPSLELAASSDRAPQVREACKKAASQLQAVVLPATP